MTTIPQVNNLNQEEQQLLLTLLLQKAGLTIANNIEQFVQVESKPLIETIKPKKLTKEERQNIRFNQLINEKQFRLNGGKAITITFTEVCLLLTKLQGNKFNIYSDEYKIGFNEYTIKSSKKNYFPSLIIFDKQDVKLEDYQRKNQVHIDSNLFTKINYHVTKSKSNTYVTIHFTDRNYNLIEISVIL